MVYYNRLVLYFDGASRSNPHGPAGCGWALYEMDDYGADGDRVAYGQTYLGYNVSNNQAEYEGLEAGLRFMNNNSIACDGLYIRGDSEIVIKQLDGIYQVRSSNITGYFRDVKSQLDYVDYSNIRYTHISRFRNNEADELANDAIDNEQSFDTWG